MASAPAGAYLGVPGADGRLSFPQQPGAADGAITVSGPLTAELTMIVEQREGSRWPATVRLGFTAGVTTSVDAAPGAAELYGTELTFDSVDRLSHDPQRALVTFDYTVSPQRWQTSSITSELATFDGEVGFTSAGWSFPLVAVPPDQLGASPGGQWSLTATSGSQLRWIGAGDRPTRLGELYLTLGPTRLTLTAAGAQALRPAVSQRLELWHLSEGRHLPAEVSYQDDFPVVYVQDSAEGETLAVVGLSTLTVDRPLRVTGEPVSPAPGKAMLRFARAAATTTVTAIFLTPQAVTGKTVLFALRNALLGLAPSHGAVLQGTMQGDTRVVEGQLSLVFGVRSWLPTLPDPYVANLVVGQRGHGLFAEPSIAPATTVSAKIAWSGDGGASVGFHGDLVAPSGVGARSSAPVEPGPAPSRPQQEFPGRFDGAHSAFMHMMAGRGHEAAEQDRHRLARLGALFGKSAPEFGEAFTLLDVSGNQGQIGVHIGLSGGRAAAKAYRVDGLDLVTPVANVRVFALPQVQWEPVRTLDRDQDIAVLGYFPTPLASATDGGPTLLGMRSSTLVPTVPDVVAATVREEFHAGRPAALMTTLPFGIQTTVSLRPAPAGSRAADSFAFNQPGFPGAGVHGAWQLTVEAGADAAAYPGASPTFDGAAVQLRNGVDLATGTPLGISVLGGTNDPPSTVETLFNNEFAPDGAQPRVPVTRLDISGYGGSTFSDWSNPLAQFAQASKVQFAVMVGRTAFEFVKFASILYPWGIRVTRSVTVERRANGGVVRRDSGWQPASPGLFDFRWQAADGTQQPSPYRFHPGLLGGLYQVSGLRPAGTGLVSFTGDGGREVQLAPFYFDARARIDGLDGADDVFARGLLGFLHLKPVGVPLSPAELKRLIQLQSPIGGPVDCDVNVGGSGFRAHATRIEVDTADEAGGVRFVGAVRCAPTFVQSGAWAAVRLPGPGNTTAPQDATTVDGSRGLPIVRSGPLVIGSSPVQIAGGGDYRFADPADLFQANPPFDYGFVQTSPAHAFLFRRPFVSPNVAELRSALAPCFADLFARVSSKGLFPPVADAITLPGNALSVNPASGAFRLRDAVNLPAPRGPLNSGQSAGERVRVFYDEAVLHADIGETSWSVNFTGVGVWSDMLGVERFSGTKMRMIASERQRPQATEITTHFHPDFEDALKFIPNFSNRGVHGPVDLAASNEDHELQLFLNVFKKFHLIPDKLELKLFYTMGMGLATEEHTHTWRAMIASKVGAELQAKIPISGIFFLVLGLALEAGVKDLIADGKPAERELKLKAMVGVGVGTTIAGCKAEVFLAVGVIFAVTEKGVGVGGLVLLDGEIDLKIVKVHIEAELQGVIRGTNPPDEPPDKKACDYEGEVGVHVEVCFFLSIDFSYTYKDTEVL